MATVMCRICRQRFDREQTKEGEYWVRPSKNMYYHKECYENWKSQKADVTSQLTDKKWESYIWDFLAHDMKFKYDYQKCKRQIENFIKKYSYTYKGIYFSLKYFYEIKKGDWSKSENGVGIIPYIYADSCEYWQNRLVKDKEVINSIEKQIEDRLNRPKKIVYQKRKKEEKKKAIDLNDITLEDD